jgi:phosphoribosylformylglycinamidine (FGAM) synthase PurS component
MKNSLYQFADEYINLEIEGKIINIPYSISKEGIKRAIGELSSAGVTDRFANYGGKGTPKQIKELIFITAQKEHFSLKKATVEEITEFLLHHGIGVDCSGFVYNVLDQYLKKEKHKSLDTLVLRYSGIAGKLERFILQKNRVRRSSAVTLTNELNTIKIKKVKDIKPGDMIRFTHSDWKGKHIGIIVAINEKLIVYAMSSQYTKTQGARFGKITIKDKNKGLEYQEWHEETKKGENYGKDAFDPSRGDSVRRLKYLYK